MLTRSLRHSLRSLVSPLSPAKPANRKLKVVLPYTMVEPDRLDSLFNRARDITADGTCGDVVECGVCNGGSAAAIALGLQPDRRHLWLFDSFKGMPMPSKIDGGEAEAWVGKCVGVEAKVREILAKVGQPEDLTTIRQGWFHETFCEPLPEKIAILHIDADWYDSVLLSLRTFYDRVENGGFIILDDFGWWEGCREAFFDFCHEQKIKPLAERCGSSQLYWMKAKSHNRCKT